MASKSDLILVTGATGKQGGAVARELLTAGALVTVTGRVEPDLMTTCQQGTPLIVESARRG